jgi:hypothetical protein
MLAIKSGGMSFYTDMLGFKVPDWMGDRFSFLRCGRAHHRFMNFARHDVPGISVGAAIRDFLWL